MLTPDHPGLHRVPPAPRESKGSPRRPPSGSSRMPPVLRKSGGAPRHRCKGRRGSPKAAPTPGCAAVLPLCSQQGPVALPGPPWAAGQPRPSRPPLGFSCCPQPGSHAPSRGFPCPAQRPQSGHPLPCAPDARRPGGGWNVPCLRSQPEFDLSWAETRGKWPRTTRSFTSFPDLAAAGARLPNQAGFGQDICSSAGHKAHLDPLRELRAIKFS